MPILTLAPVMTKATKRFPSQETDYTAIINVGKSISVSRKGSPANVFKLGDYAEYDSYNLSYYGPITKITAKTITITDRYGRDDVRRLDLNTFCWRNYNFNLNETVEANAITSQCI